MIHRDVRPQVLLAATLLALGLPTAVRADFDVQYQLSPGETLPFNAQFGHSTSISGDLAVVGAHLGDGAETTSGTAYVFERDVALGWRKVAKLVADDGVVADQFGVSVSISAEPGSPYARIVVGASGDDYNAVDNAGAAYVFERDAGGTWRQTAKLVPDPRPDECIDFGQAVAIDGDILVVGAPGCNYNFSHRAYVFERDPESPSDSSAWIQTAVLNSDVPTGTQSSFGETIDVNGDVAILGDPDEDVEPGTVLGAAYVFRRQNLTTWMREAKFQPDTSGDHTFGEAVSVSGNRCIVGAQEGSQHGVVYIFEDNGAGWSRVYRRKADDKAGMGRSVSISGNGAISGAISIPAVQAFLRAVGTGWADQVRFSPVPLPSNSLFGISVDLDGQRAIVGASNAYSTRGTAYIFEPAAPQGLSVSGTVYESGLPDTVCSPSGPGIEGRLVLATSTSGATPDQIVSTRADGTFTLGLPAGEYGVRLLPRDNWSQTCPTDGAGPVDYDVLVDRDMQGLDFASAGGVDVEDLSISVFAMHPPETGRYFDYAVTCWNHGTVPLDATITLELPDTVIYVGSTDGGVLDGHQVTWTYPMPADSAIYRRTRVQLDQSTLPPYLLHASAHVDPTAADVNPADNDDVDDSWVAGSFDPNDKVVDPSGNIQVDQRLTYHIRFQNVGTADADDIVVRDTLDDNLDLSTLALTATSHPCSLSTYGREVVWTFQGIHLPDSTTSEPDSHGFVEFTIKPMPDLAPGAVVSNRAGIYFDFNPVVMTNTVENAIGDVAGAPAPPAGAAASMISFYSVAPNPGAEDVTFRIGLGSPGVLSLDVFDVRGRRVRSLRRKEEAGTWSLTWDGRDERGEPAASGVYFARVRLDSDRGESATSTRRLVRLR